MRRLVFLFLVILTACHGLPLKTLPTATVTPGAVSTYPAASPSTTASPSQTVLPPGTSTPVPAPFTSTPFPLPLSTDIYTVQYHPEGGLYVGDQVSFEVISPPGADLKGKSLQVQVSGTQAKKLGPVAF